MEKYDVIVIGIGALGSAVCYHLTKRGVRVDIPQSMRLIEQFKNKEKKLVKRINDLTGLRV